MGDQHGISVPNHVNGQEVELLAGNLDDPELGRSEVHSGLLERRLQGKFSGQLKVKVVLCSWHHE